MGHRKLCSVEGCNRFSRSWGFCSMHFQRARKHGDPRIKSRQAKGETGFKCTVDGCNRKHKAKGFCYVHYQRFKRFGDPLFTKIRLHGEGTINRDGYRKITLPGGRRMFEHRYVMEQNIGRSLHKGEIVHHIDGNRLNNIFENLTLISDQNTHVKHSPNCLLALKKGRKLRWSTKQ